MITRDLRHALARALTAEGFPASADLGLRPTGTPGQYAAGVALALAARPRETAASLAARLRPAHWIAAAEVTGPGYLTITVTPQALAAVPDAVTAAGPACATSDALAGLAVPAPPRGDPLAAPTWEEARTALAARLTARLAAAAGATLTEWEASERSRLTLPAQASSLDPSPRVASEHFTNSDDEAGAGRPRSEGSAAEPGAEPHPRATEVAAAKAGAHDSSLGAAIAFCGRDAVAFTLARAVPGKPLQVDQEIIARHVPGNPAYAVRYAHARAASGVRWAVLSRGGDPPPSSGDTGIPARESAARLCLPADPGELALVDALSWLPERVATAARRGRPDEFARYLEDLARVTVDALSSPSHQGSAAPGSDRLRLARAAQTGLAAGLGLLGVSAPERL